jgi:hypothetical protein
VLIRALRSSSQSLIVLKKFFPVIDFTATRESLKDFPHLEGTNPFKIINTQGVEIELKATICTPSNNFQDKALITIYITSQQNCNDIER